MLPVFPDNDPNDTGLAAMNTDDTAALRTAKRNQRSRSPPRIRPKAEPKTPAKKRPTSEPPSSSKKVKDRATKGTKRKEPHYQPLTHADGLDMAYTSPFRASKVDDVVFLAGTDPKNPTDLADDLLVMQGEVRKTHKYRVMKEWIRSLTPLPYMLVGDSLGAAVARAIGEDLGILTTKYDDPTPTFEKDEPGNFKSKWDPITLANQGAIADESLRLDVHSYKPLAKRRSIRLAPFMPDDNP